MPIVDPYELKLTVGDRTYPCPPELRFSALESQIVLLGHSVKDIRQLSDANRELRRELATKNEALAGAYKDRDSSNAERDEAKRVLERRTGEVESLISQRDNWRTEAFANKDRAVTAETERTELLRDVTSTKNTLEGVRKQRDTYRHSAEGHKARALAVEVERDELKRELAVKSDDFDSMLAQRDKWRDSSTDFKNRALAAETEHRETKAELPRLNATINTLTRARGQMLKERNEYLELLKTTRAEALDERNKTLNVTKERDDALEAEKRAKRDAANLRVRLSYPQSERVTGGAVKVHIERDLYESQRDKAIRELKQFEEKWEKERGELTARIGELRKSVASLRMGRQDAGEACARAHAQAEVRHSNDMADILTQRDKAKAEVNRLEILLDRAKADIRELGEIAKRSNANEKEAVEVTQRINKDLVLAAEKVSRLDAQLKETVLDLHTCRRERDRYKLARRISSDLVVTPIAEPVIFTPTPAPKPRLETVAEKAVADAWEGVSAAVHHGQYGEASQLLNALINTVSVAHHVSKGAAA